MLSAVSLPMKNSGMCVNRMMLARAGVKKLKEEIRTTAPKHPGLGQPINWLFVQKGREGHKQIISFRLKQEVRNAVMRLFNADRRKLNPRKKQQKIDITTRFRNEFIAVYTRYRNEAMKEKGKRSEYQMMERDHKNAEIVALNCFNAEVTPAEVLEHWHKKLSRFANRGIDVVPMNMMMSASVVDEVAIEKMSSERAASDLDESDVRDWSSPKRKTMWLGDASALHPRLRRELMAAGFDLSRHNDADLSTIQDYAIEVKSNIVGIKMIPESLRPMIVWALANTLKNYGAKDFLYKG